MLGWAPLAISCFVFCSDMAQTSHPFRRWISLAVKIAVSIGLIWFALRTTNFTVLTDRLMSLPAYLVLAVLALLWIQAAMATWRWCHVARANQIPLAFPAAFRILMIGIFFNQTLPSSVGGDIFRIWLLHRRGTGLGQATGNVLLDRIVGLEALLLTSLFGIPVLFSTVPGLAPWSILAFALSGFLAFAALLALGGRLGSFLDRWRTTRAVRSAARSAWWLVTHPADGLAVLGLSISVHLITVLCIATLLRGLGHDVAFPLLAALIPPVFVATVVPISLAGWGVRESAMIFILGIAGIPAADALATSLLFGVGVFVTGFPGGLLWLTSSRTKEMDRRLEQNDLV